MGNHANSYYKPSQKLDFGSAQGGTALQPAGILKYVKDLKRGPNTEIGQKDFFEIASIYEN